MKKVAIGILLFCYLLSAVEYSQKDKFIINLSPSDNINKKDKSGNVLQGIASFSKYWFVSQSIKNRYILFNILNENGKSIFEKQFIYASHGQDISLKIKNNGQIKLYTTGSHWEGIAEFSIEYDKDRDSFKNMKLENKYLLNIGKNTPSISEDSNYFVTKANNSIYIYRYSDLIANSNITPKVIFSFLLSKQQRKKGEWFQGLAMKDGYIYCLTGNSKINSKKYLYVYDSYGKVIKYFSLKTGKVFAKKNGLKWELEGLAFKNNTLYTTVMAGSDGKNKKRLYEILHIL